MFSFFGLKRFSPRCAAPVPCCVHSNPWQHPGPWHKHGGWESPHLSARLRRPPGWGHHAEAVWPDTLPRELPEALVPGWALFASSNAANEGAVNLFVVYSM